MTTLRTLINGVERSDLDARDRGLQYGDGLFETLAVVDGKVRRLDAHLARLLAGCARLKIPPPPRAALEREIRVLANGQARAVLKLTVTRGVSDRGYGPPVQAVPTRILSLSAWPNYPETRAQEGVAVRLCDMRLGDQPALAGIKHLNRLEQVLARGEWPTQGEGHGEGNGEGKDFAEGLMRDRRGALICGTMSNLFAVVAGKLLTPRLDRCGVAGVTRAAVLDAATRQRIAAEETELTLEMLERAEEVFLTNTLIGIWPVRRVEQRPYAVGPLTGKLQDALSDEIR